MTDTPDDDMAIPDPEGASDIIQTDYEIGQDNITPKIGPFGLDIHNPVFLVSGIVIVAFVLLTLAFQTSVGPMFNALRGWLTSSLDWFFLTAGNIFVLVCLGLIVTPLGKVRLGGKDATPDYTYVGWFSMLFAAGMGIGLMFFGVLEPVYHMAISEPLGVASPFDADGNLIPRKRRRSAGRWAWPPRSITGVCTLGRSMPWSRWHWRCSPSTRACR